jgi:hypothetical protein
MVSLLIMVWIDCVLIVGHAQHDTSPPSSTSEQSLHHHTHCNLNLPVFSVGRSFLPSVPVAGYSCS